MQNKSGWNFYTDNSGEWRWQNFSKNGVVTTSLYGYKNKQNCLENAINNGYKPDHEKESVSKNYSSKINTFLMFFLAFLFSLLIISVFWRPVFTSDSFYTSSVDLNFEKVINTNTGYPKIELDSKYLIEFSNDRQTVAKHYNTSYQDYSQGQNQVKLTKIKDYWFFRLKAHNSIEYDIYVDTLEPKIKILNYFFKDGVLEVKLEIEEDSIVFINGFQVREDGSKDGWFALDSDTESYTIYAQDQVGNTSKVETIYR